jgi:hypothetical protein
VFNGSCRIEYHTLRCINHLSRVAAAPLALFTVV